MQHPTNLAEYKTLKLHLSFNQTILPISTQNKCNPTLSKNKISFARKRKKNFFHKYFLLKKFE